MKRFFLLASSFLLLASPVFAQTNPSASVGASAQNTDFSQSWTSLEYQQDGKYLVTIHVENSGGLTSKDGNVSLVLSSGWKFKGTTGDAGLVRTSDKPYGELVEWQLNPLEGGQAFDLQTTLLLPDSQPTAPLFVALSSAYSVPVYTVIGTATSSEKLPLWSSWIRSFGTYVSLTLHELWYRLTLGIRLSLEKT